MANRLWHHASVLECMLAIDMKGWAQHCDCLCRHELRPDNAHDPHRQWPSLKDVFGSSSHCESHVSGIGKGCSGVPCAPVRVNGGTRLLAVESPQRPQLTDIFSPPSNDASRKDYSASTSTTGASTVSTVSDGTRLPAVGPRKPQLADVFGCPRDDGTWDSSTSATASISSAADPSWPCLAARRGFGKLCILTDRPPPSTGVVRRRDLDRPAQRV